MAVDSCTLSNDVIQLSHNSVLLFLSGLHVEEAQSVVGQRNNVIFLHESVQLFQCAAFFQVLVQAVKTDINTLDAVLSASLQVSHQGLVSTTAVAIPSATLVKTHLKHDV